MQQHGWMSKTLRYVKKAQHKCTVWLNSYKILEKTKLFWQKADQWLLQFGECEERIFCKGHEESVGRCPFILYFCFGDGCTMIYSYKNFQTVHLTLMSLLSVNKISMKIFLFWSALLVHSIYYKVIKLIPNYWPFLPRKSTLIMSKALSFHNCPHKTNHPLSFYLFSECNCCKCPHASFFLFVLGQKRETQCHPKRKHKNIYPFT